MKLKDVCIVVLCALSSAVFAASPVRINEFVASNGNGLADEDGEYSDWIELFNGGPDPVNLDEWYLTDDAGDLNKWEFPSVTIPAGGYVVVFASGKDRTTPKLHTSFSLSEGGEYLALVHRDGTILTAFSPMYPSQRRDVSYGFDSSGGLVFFTTPTPGSANGGTGTQFVADTTFSHDRGFYDAPFDLIITTTTPGATIRYTLNGIPPTATTGTVYTGPIRISSTTTLRAAAFRSGFEQSNVDTHTYIFVNDVIHQSPNGAPPPGWPGSWGGNVVDYGMDPAIVNHAEYGQTIKDDLKTIPTFSVVMDLDDLFGSSGIYSNPGQDGRNWERACSLELIYPDGREGFQENAGIRIRGGFSRSTQNPKHAFRFFFRQEYGAGKLNYPLFGEDAADEFDKFDLRTFQNYSWSFQGDSQGIFMRDVFSRDTQAEMGYHSERGDYFHLYINGHYWGLYNTCERPEAAYGESYLGGLEGDYDTVKVEAGPYALNATDGNMTAWTALYNLAKAGLSSDAAFQRLMGNNPDGSPNPSYPVYIDLNNLIDYMLIIIYTGNKDAPISNFIGNDRPNNWYGLRNRNVDARMGFQFFAHDSEHTLLVGDLNIDRTGPFPAGDTSVSYSSPQYIWKQLTANAEFRMKVADRIQKYFFNDGLLTPEANRDRLLRRRAEIDRAVVAESARWGDAKRSSPLTRNNWVSAVNSVLNNFLPQRTQIVLNQLRGDGLYPNVIAPALNQYSGNVSAGFNLTMSAPAGEIYYTLDGTDPRLWGGALSSKAIRYTSGITLDRNAHVMARVRSGTAWSALVEANINIIRTFRELMISELMYNPPGEGEIDGDEFEFIEFKNVGSQELDLSGIRFTNGVEYVFPNGTRLAPGAFFVLVQNATHFTTKYPGVRVDGVFTNNLANSGEALAVIHAAGAPIQQFAYDDAAAWPQSPDGGGFSLVPKTLDPELNYSDPANWRASAELGGSPGRDDAPVDIAPIIVNEALTHTDLPAVDAIELFNPTAAGVDISGWFLSDDQGTPAKFKIPNGTTIPAGGYLVFDEADFNANPGNSTSFSLSSQGDEVYLFSAAADGTLKGYSQGFSFKGAANGISFGRYTNSVGEISYPAQLSVTLGAENAGPLVGPVVINEIHYHPDALTDEFIELKNITGNTVQLFDPEHPENTWRFGGVEFTFPPGAEIPPNGLVVISGVEPEVFRNRANLPAQINVFGPFSGGLQDNGELIEVLRPDGVVVETGGPMVPYVVVDAVRYDDQSPWPSGASGTGNSIERMVTSAFGNDPQNWRASPGTTSPGLNNDGNRLPLVQAGADVTIVSDVFPVSTNLTGSATDDGLPDPPRALSYSWNKVSGPDPLQIQNGTEPTATFAFPGVGTYLLRLTVSDGEFEVSDEMTVTVERPLAQQTFVAGNATWKFLDDGSNQGTAWRGVNFPDTSWDSGPAPLGYGDPVTTTVGFGPNGSAKYQTTYFRHTFNVSSARNVISLLISLVRDDGAVVYLNGTEVFRSNIPAGEVNYQTWAGDVVGGADEEAVFQQQADPALLRDGSNVIALELHQENGNSTDLRFALQLDGLVNFENQPPSANAGPDLAVAIPNAAILNGVAMDDGLPIPPGVFNASWSIISGPASVSFANANLPQTTATFTQAGTYVLRLNVTDGQLSASDDVQVTVTGGNDPYEDWKSDHFTAAELGDPAISGDDADPDGDTMPNEAEFICGTDPRDKTDFLHVVEVSEDQGDFAIQFEIVGDKSYSVLARDEINGGTWERVVDLSPQGGAGEREIIEVLDTIPEESRKRFYRIITPQLNPQ